MRYEWDDAKAATNLARHAVDFRDAIPALNDPHRIERIDGRFPYDEERTSTIGMARAGILFVITTLHGEDENTCRIISARKATRHEQDRYYHREA